MLLEVFVDGDRAPRACRGAIGEASPPVSGVTGQLRPPRDLCFLRKKADPAHQLVRQVRATPPKVRTTTPEGVL